MEHHAVADAAVTVALALAAGMLAQALSRHLMIPGIVLLLGAGVVLGPDLADVVRPDTLGDALQILVGFAVAVILFEGGLNLNFKRLKREALVIRRLLTIGALITAVGGAVAANLLMGWDWRLAVLFGTLVIVTGPTVITPLLRRIRVRHRVETVLEAEGVLIDAIGAVVAVVALQFVIRPSGSSFAQGLLDVGSRLGFGLVLGAAGGLGLAFLLRYRKVVPEGLENTFTLSMVLALFQVSNAVLPESGIMTVTAAGMVVGNARTRVRKELAEFKEQLTVMFIGMLFVLLAADVRIEQVRGLGAAGLGTVACLMFLVRPLNVAASTWGSELTFRERGFVAWLSPRGVVAAAVASFFAQEIAGFGIQGGDDLRALVFLVIAVTVTVQGLTGGIVANLLGQRRRSHKGYAILGANELGRALGRLFREAGEEVLFIDSSPAACHAVEQDGFRVVYGNAVDERTLQRAQVEDRAALLAVTPNEEINFLVAREAGELKVPEIHVALRKDRSTVVPERVRDAGYSVLFGRQRDLELWTVRLRRGLAEIEKWRLDAPREPEDDLPADLKPAEDTLDIPPGVLLPLTVSRNGKIWPTSDRRLPKKGDVVGFAVFTERRDEGRAWLEAHGWVPEPETEKVEKGEG